jgi:altronate hydrolase
MIETAEEHNASSVIRPHPADNVGVVLIDVCLGEAVPSGNVAGRAQVSARYKIAARRIAAGEPIRKYKVVTGFPATAIDAGSLAHDHDTGFREFERNYVVCERISDGELALRCGARDVRRLRVS